MVLAQIAHERAPVRRHESATVPNVGHVAHLAHDQHHDGARARPLDQLLLKVGARREADLPHELLLGLVEALGEGLLRVPGEAFLPDYEVVQVVSQELSAQVAAVAIVDSEERALWPVLVLAVLGLDDV